MPDPLDQVILVNDQDEVLGTMDKVEAHRGSGKLHRAISVYLFNHKGELLLQQRSSKKIVGAGQWANTCCGNVRPTENYLECAQRRLREELGITGVVLQPLEKFQYQAKCNEEFSEHEIDQVFVGAYEAGVTPNPLEVARVEWVAFGDVLKRKLNGKVLAPWFEIMLHRESLIINLTAVAESFTTVTP